MKSIAIITARGGSKRIPRKNIKEFCGKPILAYSIEAALASNIFESVMVSTDDEEIAEIAKKYGAEVPFYRSEKTSNDFATTSDVLMEVLGEYEKQGKTYEGACCIYPTAPFVTADVLKRAEALMREQEADSVVPVVRFSFPPQRSIILEDGYLRFRWPEHINSRSQDLESFYHDAGQFYFFNVASFLKHKMLVMPYTLPFELPALQVQDIDSEEDWKIAELKFRLFNEKRG